MGRTRHTIGFGILLAATWCLYAECMKLKYELAIKDFECELYKAALEDDQSKTISRGGKWPRKKDSEGA